MSRPTAGSVGSGFVSREQLTFYCTQKGEKVSAARDAACELWRILLVRVPKKSIKCRVCEGSCQRPTEVSHQRESKIEKAALLALESFEDVRPKLRAIIISFRASLQESASKSKRAG